MFEIGHFEFMVADLKKGMDFYGKLFGWKIEMAPGMDNYAMFEPGNPNMGGGISPMGKPSTMVYVNVPSVDEWIGKAKELGAPLAMPKTALPMDMGFIAVIVSPDGNPVGIWSK
jgi:uncharacterized protein